MAELVIASPAEREYAEALCWYADRSITAAERFEAEFQRALESVASTPDRYPICDDRHRFFLMRRFPYQLIYRHGVDRVTVVAVAHTSRKPFYWSDR